MATTSLTYFILRALSAREMTGYELTAALHADGAPIEKGDGYLYPILYLMEETELLSSFEDDSCARRYFRITPFGLMRLSEMQEQISVNREAPSEEEEVLDTVSADHEEVSLSEFAVEVSRDIPRKKLQKHFAGLYTAHIEDACNAGQSEGDVAAALGDPATLRQALCDVTNAVGKRVIVSPRFWMLSGIALLFIAAVVGLYFLWGIFVVEVAAIVAGVFVAAFLFRFFRTYHKRARAYRQLKRAAAENGYTLKKRQTVFSSVFWTRPYPSVVLERGDSTYHIRFVGAWKRLRILKFLSPYFYQISTMKGVAVAPTRPIVGHAFYFKPKGMKGDLFKLYHTDLVEFDGSFRSLPLYEKRHLPVDHTVTEVLLLNPVPMRATYRAGNTEHTIVGGENLGGVLFHDVPGFCEYLRRGKKS